MEGFQSRHAPADGLDDFPTPKWATRAFMAHCMPDGFNELTVWEPCANRGYMVEALREYCGTVIGSDIHDYGAGFPIIDFLTGASPMDHGMEVDAIVTNPPFNLATEFFERWRSMEVETLAMFLRTGFMEGTGRYNKIFNVHCPTYICQYAERVPIVQGRLDKDVGTRMPYAWFIWNKSKDKHQRTRVQWIPPCRKDYDHDSDWPE